MESDKQNIVDRSTRSTSSSSGCSYYTLPLIFSLIAGLLSIIALVLGAASFRQGTTNYNVGVPSSGLLRSNNDKIWLIAIGHDGTRAEYIDERSGEIKGFNVDLVNAVCNIANKNCRLVFDIYSRCWDSKVGETQRGGQGLFTGYYDACTYWSSTYIRTRTFQFSKPYTKSGSSGFAVLPGNPGNFNWRDLSGKTIGFIDGFYSDEACVLRQSDTINGANLPALNIVHYLGREELIAGLKAGEVDAIFDGKYKIQNEVEFVSDDIKCALSGASMMTRKDNRFTEWWNPALERLMATTKYRTICNDLTEKHGHMAGSDAGDTCLGM